MKYSRIFFLLAIISGLIADSMAKIPFNQRYLIDDDVDSGTNKLLKLDPPELNAQPIPANIVVKDFGINTANREKQMHIMSDLESGVENLQQKLGKIDRHIKDKTGSIRKLIEAKFKRFEESIRKATADIDSATP